MIRRHRPQSCVYTYKRRKQKMLRILFVMSVILMPLTSVFAVLLPSLFADPTQNGWPLFFSFFCLFIFQALSAFLYLRSGYRHKLLENYRKRLYEQKLREIDYSIARAHDTRD